MSDSLSDLIFSLTPEDGSSIGNGALVALLREQLPNLTEDEYEAARDELIEEGLLERGRGRGGSVFRNIGSAEYEDEAEESGEDFKLAPTDEPAPRQQKASSKKKPARRADGAVQVLSYRHKETRVNNPEVGMVHADTDPDGENTSWAYDPHLDPALNFDSARAEVERLTY